VKLVSGVDIPARSRTVGPAGAPAGSSEGPPGGPGGGAPSGGPPGIPSGGAPRIPGGGAPGIPGGGPSGGYAPPQPCRAILREIDGKLTWLHESFDASTKAWVERLRELAEL
jgi:hypothetical protein